MRATNWQILSGALALALCAAPAALAATGPAQGETSGPASGTPTKPNTAVEKHAANSDAAAATGGAGVAGKPGVESGRATGGSSGSGKTQ